MFLWAISLLLFQVTLFRSLESGHRITGVSDIDLKSYLKEKIGQMNDEEFGSLFGDRVSLDTLKYIWSCFVFEWFYTTGFRSTIAANRMEAMQILNALRSSVNSQNQRITYVFVGSIVFVFQVRCLEGCGGRAGRFDKRRGRLEEIHYT